jgi:hypothetical protein
MSRNRSTSSHRPAARLQVALLLPPGQPVQSFGLSRNAEEARTDDHGIFYELRDSGRTMTGQGHAARDISEARTRLADESESPS